VRCRASYGVAERGENLTLNLRCASDSYNFDLAGDVAYRGGAISGSWREAAHNAAGTLSGHAAGDHIVAAANGNNFVDCEERDFILWRIRSWAEGRGGRRAW
jgi:hypothetical protein